ncbi:hypothetical protein CYMTET_27650 [Cymbomonas tetramitiformis]|uniref:Uncharacterized protein n=1 Tax=Cymbomonas tetramitiformis TaxID=36881 RepID=A0AAE0FPX7_9CHLO|nr:hypothetical protein CYMTET_27650 [Cymbomonas tetramitiformis]
MLSFTEATLDLQKGLRKMMHDSDRQEGSSDALHSPSESSSRGSVISRAFQAISLAFHLVAHSQLVCPLASQFAMSQLGMRRRRKQRKEGGELAVQIVQEAAASVRQLVCANPEVWEQADGETRGQLVASFSKLLLLEDDIIWPEAVKCASHLVSSSGGGQCTLKHLAQRSNLEPELTVNMVKAILQSLRTHQPSQGGRRDSSKIWDLLLTFAEMPDGRYFLLSENCSAPFRDQAVDGASTMFLSRMPKTPFDELTDELLQFLFEQLNVKAAADRALALANFLFTASPGLPGNTQEAAPSPPTRPGGRFVAPAYHRTLHGARTVKSSPKVLRLLRPTFIAGPGSTAPVYRTVVQGPRRALRAVLRVPDISDLTIQPSDFQPDLRFTTERADRDAKQALLKLMHPDLLKQWLVGDQRHERAEAALRAVLGGLVVTLADFAEAIDYAEQMEDMQGSVQWVVSLCLETLRHLALHSPNEVLLRLEETVEECLFGIGHACYLLNAEVITHGAETVALLVAGRGVRLTPKLLEHVIGSLAQHLEVIPKFHDDSTSATSSRERTVSWVVAVKETVIGKSTARQLEDQIVIQKDKLVKACVGAIHSLLDEASWRSVCVRAQPAG